MGHVDAGKTTLLDAICSSNIVSKEPGKITQGIGATFIDIHNLLAKSKSIGGRFKTENLDKKLPGILVIDTPGHEAFGSFRKRGATLCDIAILVIDIEEGLQPQTMESLKLLVDYKIPFVIALSKIDKVYGWKSVEDLNLKNSFKRQSRDAQGSLEGYIAGIKSELASDKLGKQLNLPPNQHKHYQIKSDFYLKNKKPEKVYSIVPINGQVREGVPDLLALMLYISTNWMSKRLKFKADKLEGTVMETMFDKRLGWVIDIILANGTLERGQHILVCQSTGVIKITIRNLLLPSSSGGSRWDYVDSVNASASVCIIASNLQDTLAGTHIYSEDQSDIATSDMESVPTGKILNDAGPVLVANTLGALQAAINLLDKSKVKVSMTHVGRILPKDIERWKMFLPSEKANRVVMMFGDPASTGTKIAEIEQKLKASNIHLLVNSVVYQLVEQYEKYSKDCQKESTDALVKQGKAIYPCELEIIKKYIFMKGGSDDILMGVKLLKGRLKIGTPLNVVRVHDHTPASGAGADTSTSTSVVCQLGKVTSIQKNSKEVTDDLKVGDEVCIRIDNPNHLTYDRQFTHTDRVVSSLDRDSINILKTHFKDQMKKADWLQVIEIKQLLCIR